MRIDSSARRSPPSAVARRLRTSGTTPSPIDATASLAAARTSSSRLESSGQIASSAGLLPMRLSVSSAWRWRTGPSLESMLVSPFTTAGPFAPTSPSTMAAAMRRSGAASSSIATIRSTGVFAAMRPPLPGASIQRPRAAHPCRGPRAAEGPGNSRAASLPSPAMRHLLLALLLAACDGPAATPRRGHGRRGAPDAGPRDWPFAEVPAVTEPEAGVRREVLTIDGSDAPANPTSGDDTPAALDRVQIVRFSPAGASDVRAVIVAVPGLLGGAGSWEMLARHLVRRSRRGGRAGRGVGHRSAREPARGSARPRRGGGRGGSRDRARLLPARRDGGRRGLRRLRAAGRRALHERVGPRHAPRGRARGDRARAIRAPARARLPHGPLPRRVDDGGLRGLALRRRRARRGAGRGPRPGGRRGRRGAHHGDRVPRGHLRRDHERPGGRRHPREPALPRAPRSSGSRCTCSRSSAR
ncbi:MAG: hypothetical protein M5U28_03855 [Sandaracinaceae bacterium]|nr:hypothetical protein [Sandaracinaceae bacterium]